MGTLHHMNIEQLILWVFETSCHGYVIITTNNLYNYYINNYYNRFPKKSKLKIDPLLKKCNSGNSQNSFFGGNSRNC